MCLCFSEIPFCIALQESYNSLYCVSFFSRHKFSRNFDDLVGNYKQTIKIFHTTIKQKKKIRMLCFTQFHINHFIPYIFLYIFYFCCLSISSFRLSKWLLLKCRYKPMGIHCMQIVYAICLVPNERM